MQSGIEPGRLILFASLLLGACSPEFGSEGWCTDLENKPKVEWTAEEIKGYTKYCIGRGP